MKKILIFVLFIFSVFEGFSTYRVLLTWDPNKETDIAGYRIYYGTNSRLYSVIIDVGNVTNTIVTNLSSSTTFYFAATAYNTSSLESDLSEEVSLTTPDTNTTIKATIPKSFAVEKHVP